VVIGDSPQLRCHLLGGGVRRWVARTQFHSFVSCSPSHASSTDRGPVVLPFAAGAALALGGSIVSTWGAHIAAPTYRSIGIE